MKGRAFWAALVERRPWWFLQLASRRRGWWWKSVSGRERCLRSEGVVLAMRERGRSRERRRGRRVSRDQAPQTPLNSANKASRECQDLLHTTGVSPSLRSTCRRVQAVAPAPKTRAQALGRGERCSRRGCHRPQKSVLNTWPTPFRNNRVLAVCTSFTRGDRYSPSRSSSFLKGMVTHSPVAGGRGRREGESRMEKEWGRPKERKWALCRRGDWEWLMLWPTTQNSRFCRKATICCIDTWSGVTALPTLSSNTGVRKEFSRRERGLPCWMRMQRPMRRENMRERREGRREGEWEECRTILRITRDGRCRSTWAISPAYSITSSGDTPSQWMDSTTFREGQVSSQAKRVSGQGRRALHSRSRYSARWKGRRDSRVEKQSFLRQGRVPSERRVSNRGLPLLRRTLWRRGSTCRPFCTALSSRTSIRAQVLPRQPSCSSPRSSRKQQQNRESGANSPGEAMSC